MEFGDAKRLINEIDLLQISINEIEQIDPEEFVKNLNVIPFDVELGDNTVVLMSDEVDKMLTGIKHLLKTEEGDRMKKLNIIPDE